MMKEECSQEAIQAIRSSYTIVYERPVGLASAHVVITATVDGAPVAFDLGTVTFQVPRLRPTRKGSG